MGLLSAEEESKVTASANTSAKSDKAHHTHHTMVMNLPDQIMDSQIVENDGYLNNQDRPVYPADSSGTNKYVDDRFLLEKIQNTISEYNYLLSSQLEEQRAYFELKMHDVTDKVQNRKDPMVNAQLEELGQTLETLQQNLDVKRNIRLKLQADRDEAKHQHKSLLTKVAKCKTDLQLESEVNASLKAGQQKLEQEMAERERLKQEGKPLPRDKKASRQ